MGCGDNERITAFTKVRLVPMTEEEIVENQTVIVKGDRIFKIGPSNKIEIPQSANVIDGAGAGGRSFNWERVQNRTHSEWQTITVAQELE
jgi:hypothetical protein